MGFLINVSRYADEVHGVFDDLPRNANDNNNVPLFALIFLMPEDKYSLGLQMRRQPAASSLPNINIHQFLKIFCHLTSFSLALKLRLSGALNHGQNKLRHTHRMNTGILCALAAESATVILSPPRPQRHNPIYMCTYLLLSPKSEFGFSAGDHLKYLTHFWATRVV